MKYCDTCIFLSVTEREQRRLEKLPEYRKRPISHTCTLLDKRIRHLGSHPKLPRLPDCPLGEE